jgi:hypothetical protein
VGEEFKLVTDRIKVGKTMEESLQDTADRLNMAEFSFFCITLAIQRETGGNLAETLANLADVLRKRAQMKLKIKGDELGIQGLGLYHRRAAVHRVRPALLDQPGLHGQVLHRRAPDRGRSLGACAGWAWAASSWPRWSTSRSEGPMEQHRRPHPARHQCHPCRLDPDDDRGSRRVLLAIYAAVTVRVPWPSASRR